MINRILKSKYLLAGLQFFTLFIFIFLILGGIGVTTHNPKFAIILRNTNLSNLVIWSYWWPLIILTAIFLGRFWCSICPMELITSFFSKIGLRKKPGKLIKSGWLITLFYALILIIGIHTLAIHRIPQYMAIYMLVLLSIAVLIGFIYEKRTFCTYICPIGHLLGLYSLLSPKKVGVIDSNTCYTCKTKDCISKINQYKFIGRSCTSGLYPATIKDGRDCILCGQCFKACPHNNVVFQKPKSGFKLNQSLKLSWPEITFFMMVSAFVIYEILSEWAVSKKILMALPKYANEAFQVPANFNGTIKAIILFIIFPLAFYSFLAFAKRLVANENWKSAFTQLVLAILPIAASMHVLKALLKTTSRIPYWNLAILDPKGIDSANRIIKNPDLLNNDFLASVVSPTISMVAILLPLIGLSLSLYIIKRQAHINRSSRILTIITASIYCCLFLVGLIAWRIY
ncbi:4Fe-4S binding protein [Ancylomarina sp. YFZ004]